MKDIIMWYKKHVTRICFFHIESKLDLHSRRTRAIFLLCQDHTCCFVSHKSLEMIDLSTKKVGDHFCKWYLPPRIFFQTFIDCFRWFSLIKKRTSIVRWLAKESLSIFCTFKNHYFILTVRFIKSWNCFKLFKIAFDRYQNLLTHRRERFAIRKHVLQFSKLSF